MKPQKLTEGVWGDDVSWEFFITNELPPIELCTAVFCLALHNDEVVLTRTKRGWEMLGGHIEPGETITDALFREAHEEGGYTPEDYELFGYRKIHSKRAIPARNGEYYPFPVSYILCYIAKSTLPLDGVHGDDGEVLERRLFALSDLRSLGMESLPIIEAGLEQGLALR